jgi:hypothetical protein
MHHRVSDFAATTDRQVQKAYYQQSRRLFCVFWYQMPHSELSDVSPVQGDAITFPASKRVSAYEQPLLYPPAKFCKRLYLSRTSDIAGWCRHDLPSVKDPHRIVTPHSWQSSDKQEGLPVAF